MAGAAPAPGLIVSTPEEADSAGPVLQVTGVMELSVSTLVPVISVTGAVTSWPPVQRQQGLSGVSVPQATLGLELVLMVAVPGLDQPRVRLLPQLLVVS